MSFLAVRGLVCDARRMGLEERLLSVMDRKNHWAFPHLTRPGLTRAQHLVHFRAEYMVYVRDFPVLLARALGQVPDVLDVRRTLATNIYEEQTGGLSKSAPHAELFLEMMVGMGYSRDDFDEAQVVLHEPAKAYREYLRTISVEPPWQAAVALLTIFVEGSVHERAELAGTYVRPKGDDAIDHHPLVVHYGCPKSAMRLVRAHGDVEGGHRKEAWRMVLSGTNGNAALEETISSTCEDGLAAWLAYRDSVAEEMGLVRD